MVLDESIVSVLDPEPEQMGQLGPHACADTTEPIGMIITSANSAGRRDVLTILVVQSIDFPHLKSVEDYE